MRNYSAWEVDPDKFPAQGSLDEQIRFVCQYGLLAPSAHNTQPWTFELSNGRLLVGIDESRTLQAGDQTGREAWLSLGACVENIILAAEAFGLEADIKRQQTSRPRGVELEFKHRKSKNGKQWLEAIKGRVSNRAMYEKRPLEPGLVRRLEDCWRSDNVQLRVLAKSEHLALAAGLTGQAIGMALSIRDLKHELAGLMRPNNTKSSDGMTGASLRAGWLGSRINPWLFRHTSVSGAQSQLEARRMQACSAIILVLSKGDTAQFWLEAGRAYERAVLEVTDLRLSHSTMAALVEAPDFHQALEEAANTSYRLQALIRVGYTSKTAPHTPRRTLGDVLTSTS